MPLHDPFSWQGVFGHLLYRTNHDGFNGMGRWALHTPTISVPIPLGTDVIERSYGNTIDDRNRRVTWTQSVWSMGVAGVEAEVYTLLGRWDLGLDVIAAVKVDFHTIMRNLGAAFLRNKRSQDPAGARGMVSAVDNLTQIFPAFKVEGRMGFSMGISDAGRGYVRLSTLGKLGLKLSLPGKYGLKMGSWHDGGRHWQITLSNVAGHLPRSW